MNQRVVIIVMGTILITFESALFDCRCICKCNVIVHCCKIERIFFLSFSLDGSTFPDFPWERNPFRCVDHALVRHNKMYVSDIRLSPLRGSLLRSVQWISVYRIDTYYRSGYGYGNLRARA